MPVAMFFETIDSNGGIDFSHSFSDKAESAGC
jgi:hypothetical protein